MTMTVPAAMRRGATYVTVPSAPTVAVPIDGAVTIVGTARMAPTSGSESLRRGLIVIVPPGRIVSATRPAPMRPRDWEDGSANLSEDDAAVTPSRGLHVRRHRAGHPAR